MSVELQFSDEALKLFEEMNERYPNIEINYYVKYVFYILQDLILMSNVHKKYVLPVDLDI